MGKNLLMMVAKLKFKARELTALFSSWVRADKRRVILVGVVLFALIVFLMSHGEEKVHYIYEGKEKQFSQERVMENPFKHIAENKIEMVEESEERLRQDSRELQRQLGEVKQTLEELKSGLNRNLQGSTNQPPAPHVQPEAELKGQSEGAVKPESTANPITLYPGQENLSSASEVEGHAIGTQVPQNKSYRRHSGNLNGSFGPYSIAFPVSVKREEKSTGIVIPTGSYVKAKVIGGAQVPMGETYPALLQLDYAFVKPSNRRIDLSGCFVVAKAEGDLSTERLKMSPHSMSCYNAQGLFFKKEKLIGWANDTLDNDFGLRAEVNLNQGRVAQTAFAKALIEGLGASLERNTRSVGGKGIDDGSPNVVLKESGQKVGGMVADYYLAYLQGLRPTMKVTSGRDAWLIMGSDIELPYEFFRKETSDENQFGIVTDLFR